MIGKLYKVVPILKPVAMVGKLYKMDLTIVAMVGILYRMVSNPVPRVGMLYNMVPTSVARLVCYTRWFLNQYLGLVCCTRSKYDQKKHTSDIFLSSISRQQIPELSVCCTSTYHHKIVQYPNIYIYTYNLLATTQ